MYRILVIPAAQKQISKLDPQNARRIRAFLEERLAPSPDPRAYGTALVGTDRWRYRVGDYRIIARIDDAVVTVLIIDIDHRRDAYR